MVPFDMMRGIFDISSGEKDDFVKSAKFVRGDDGNIKLTQNQIAEWIRCIKKGVVQFTVNLEGRRDPLDLSPGSVYAAATVFINTSLERSLEDIYDTRYLSASLNILDP